MKKYLLIILAFLINITAVSAEESIIMRAMEDELARSMKELKLDDEERPYYLSYLVKDVFLVNITADSGAIISNNENHNRNLIVDLRVGDYSFDNSNFMSLSSSNVSSRISHRLTKDDDYDMLRMGAWAATDRAYMAALDIMAKKKVALQNTVQTDVLPDFTKGSATSDVHRKAPFSVKKDELESMVDQLSGIFLNRNQIQKSKIILSVQIINSYYVNSEGTKSIEPSRASQLVITATTQAEDGMPVGNLLTYTAADPEELPDLKSLETDVNKMLDDLSLTCAAPVAEDYIGPVLFVGQAAGELFSQGIDDFLLAKRIPVVDNPQLGSVLALSMGNPFLNQIDRRVASKFLSVKAAPTLAEYKGRSLLGAYQADEEGVTSRDVLLIENGMLKELLTTRVPVKGFAQSNGHSRGGAPAPGVIHVTSSNALSTEQIKQELINILTEEGLSYGYMVKGLIPPAVETEMSGSDIISSLLMQQGQSDPTQFKLTRPYSIFRVYTDGKEELVRGLEFRSHSINILKNIIATSDNEIVYDFPMNPSGVSSGIISVLASLLGVEGLTSQTYATVITPSFLISEINLKKISGNYSKPPIVAHPMK